MLTYLVLQVGAEDVERVRVAAIEGHQYEQRVSTTITGQTVDGRVAWHRQPRIIDRLTVVSLRIVAATGDDHQGSSHEGNYSPFHVVLYHLCRKDSQNIKKNRPKVHIFEIFYLFLRSRSKSINRNYQN
jgi:hypothetical protein